MRLISTSLERGARLKKIVLHLQTTPYASVASVAELLNIHVPVTREYMLSLTELSLIKHYLDARPSGLPKGTILYELGDDSDAIETYLKGDGILPCRTTRAVNGGKKRPREITSTPRVFSDPLSMNIFGIKRPSNENSDTVND